MNETKVCTKCKTEKHEQYFAFRFKDKGIRLSNCRECQKKTARSHYLRNTNLVKEKTKNNKIKARRLFIEYMDGKRCKSCGNDDIRVLEFDHRDIETKDSTVSLLVANGCGWDRIYNEIKKCDILCANCHKIKTSTQFKWNKGKNFTA